MDAVKIGNAIQTLRRRAGYTQRELADCLDVTDKAVSKWERGLGVPDISIITKLSILLNTDIDSLLEGNAAYLEHSWRGMLILNDNAYCISPDLNIRGKPLVYILLSYFLLAGIRKVTITGDSTSVHAAEKQLGDGSQFGAALQYAVSCSAGLSETAGTMIVYDNPFLYGPNVTKYFQRAISRQNGISVLAMPRNCGADRYRVAFDNAHLVHKSTAANGTFSRLPFVFCPEGYLEYLRGGLELDDLIEQKLLFAEPVGRGMVYCPMNSWDAITDISQFLSFLERNTGECPYCLEEIAWRRGLITKEKLRTMGEESTIYGQYILSLCKR